jgi:hypothetical protein
MCHDLIAVKILAQVMELATLKTPAPLIVVPVDAMPSAEDDAFARECAQPHTRSNFHRIGRTVVEPTSAQHFHLRLIETGGHEDTTRTIAQLDVSRATTLRIQDRKQGCQRMVILDRPELSSLSEMYDPGIPHP